jgi:hypothetical protein
MTLRQLLHAANARREHDWDLASWTAAIYINLKLKKGAKRVQPADINPLTRQKKKGKRMTRGTFDAICAAIAGAKHVDR